MQSFNKKKTKKRQINKLYFPLTSDEIVKDLSNFLSESDTEPEVNINDFTKQLSDILIKAASNSVTFKLHCIRTKNKNKRKHRNKWFNNNCNVMRR